MTHLSFTAGGILFIGSGANAIFLVFSDAGVVVRCLFGVFTCF